MSNHSDIDDGLLHAFIDGELDAEHVRAVEEKLMVDAALKARVEAFRADKEMFKRVYGPLIERPIPKDWKTLVRGHDRPLRRMYDWRIIASIAATLLVVSVIGIGYFSRTPHGTHDIVQVALDARRQALPSNDVIPVNAATNMASLGKTVSGVIALQVKVPDLRRMGYRLAAVRLYKNASADRSAELLYRDDKNELFTLYLRRSHGEARFDQFRRDALRVCIWQDGRLSMVMAGNVSADTMQRLASLAYTGVAF